MAKLTEWPLWAQRMLNAFQILRHLRFDPSHIFVRVQMTKRHDQPDAVAVEMLLVTLEKPNRTKDDHPLFAFAIEELANIDADRDRAAIAISAYMNGYNLAPHDERDELYRKFLNFSDSLTIAAVLQGKGLLGPGGLAASSYGA